MIIGITGGTGCGKTTALEVIRSLGGTVIDCDAVYHGLLKNDKALLEEIGSRFPNTVTNGVLDRKALGSTVFADPEALLALNAMTHPAVKAAVLKMLTPCSALAAIDAIALFEGGLSDLCNVTVAVTAPTEDRIMRLMAREGISRAYAEKRIAAQKPNAYFSSLCDYTLENTGTEADFRAKCLAFFRRQDIIKENT